MIKKKNKIVLIILIDILFLLGVIIIIDGVFSYKKHQLNQEYIHPKNITTWLCKEIDMAITYDNESKTSSDYYGKIKVNGKSINLFMGIIGTSDTMDFFESDDYNKKLFSGEFNFINQKEFELKIVDNNYLPNDITKLTFENK